MQENNKEFKFERKRVEELEKLRSEKMRSDPVEKRLDLDPRREER